jgi:hypothetical protein
VKKPAEQPSRAARRNNKCNIQLTNGSDEISPKMENIRAGREMAGGLAFVDYMTIQPSPVVPRQPWTIVPRASSQFPDWFS